MTSVQTVFFYLYLTMAGDENMVISGGKFDNKSSCEAVGQNLVKTITDEFNKAGSGTLKLTFECPTTPIDVEKINDQYAAKN